MTQIKPDLKAQLSELLRVVPPAVINGSWNLSVRYKDLVVDVNKILKGGRANEAKLQQLINQYHRF